MQPPMAASHRLPDTVRRNIDRVLQLEEHATRANSMLHSVGDGIGRFVGTLTFAAIHIAAFGSWVVFNSNGGFGHKPFDPYPFSLLSTCASCEAVVLAAFVLMTQNRMSAMADRRDHLDLQVSLTVEQETSMIIQMLDRISTKLEIPVEANIAAVRLSHTSTLERLVEELHERFPDVQGDLPK